MKIELKQCPFCGGEAERRVNATFGDMSMVACRSCGAEAYDRKWNLRSAGNGWEDEEKLTVEEAWTILCETPDITSPEEYPDHALITMEQLGSFMARSAAALAVQTQQGVEVRKLEWDGYGRAYSEVGTYNVACIAQGGVFGLWRPIDEGSTFPNDEGSEEHCRAAAQSDYETRIRSALVDVPAVESEPMALIEREVLAELAKHKTATGTVCSPLFKSKFGDKVPLYTTPPSPNGGDSGEGSATGTIGG